MIVGTRVLVFTASGTFRGVKGVVTKVGPGGAFVRVRGERQPLLFTNRELVPASERDMSLTGAE